MDNMPEAIISLVAMLNDKDEVFLLKRKADVHCPNVWSFPGGKSEDNEMPLQTALRELKEETGVAGKFWRHIGKHIFAYDDRSLAFIFFFCRYNHAPIHAESEYMWCALENLQALEMPDANKVLVKMLLECKEEGLLPPTIKNS
jgi:8-oxo-dGTP diphosphatase